MGKKHASQYANFGWLHNMLKNMAQIVHSHHRSVNNFIMNLISALGAYVATMAVISCMTAIVLFLLNCFFRYRCTSH